MIKWLLKWLEGKPVPKYLSGKKKASDLQVLVANKVANKRSLVCKIVA